MTGVFTSFSVAIFLGSLISIASLALVVLLGIWVYRDAVNRGMNGILWTLVVILVPTYIGLIIYLIVRMDAKKVTCSNCMQKVNANSKFCSKCGQELVPVVEISENDEIFRKSQKKILIGFFSTLAGIVIGVILMVAFVLSGIVGAVDSGIRAFSHLSDGFANGYYSLDADDVSDMLSSLDALFGTEGFHIDVNGDEVTISTSDGEEIIHVSEDGEQVRINTAALYGLLDKYGIEYDSLLSDEELEEAVDGYVENYINNVGGVEDKIDAAAKKLEDAVDKVEQALEKGDVSALGDFGKEIAREQKLEFTRIGEAAPFKTMTGEDEIEDFVEELDMDDWTEAKLPEDAAEIGTIGFTSEYKGMNEEMTEYKVFTIHVYKDVPYVVLEVLGMRITLKTGNEAMVYLNSSFK